MREKKRKEVEIVEILEKNWGDWNELSINEYNDLIQNYRIKRTRSTFKIRVESEIRGLFDFRLDEEEEKREEKLVPRVVYRFKNPWWTRVAEKWKKNEGWKR